MLLFSFFFKTEKCGKHGDSQILLLTGKDVTAQLSVKFVVHLEEQRELCRKLQKNVLLT